MRGWNEHFPELVYQKLTTQASRYPEVAAKLEDLLINPPDIVTHELFIQTLADGARDINSFLEIAARRKLADWIPIYLSGGPSPHFIGIELRYTLGDQAREVFSRKLRELEVLSPADRYKSLTELQIHLQQGALDSSLMGQLTLSNEPQGFLREISNERTTAPKFVVALDWILPRRVKHFTAVVAPTFNGSQRTLLNLKRVDVENISYHPFRPTLGSAFHSGEMPSPLLETLDKERMPGANFNQILVEKIVDEKAPNTNLDVARRVADMVNTPTLTDVNSYISIRFLKDGVQVGANALHIPLLAHRAGVNLYQITLNRGPLGLWTKKRLEIRHNLLTNTFDVTIRKMAGNFVYSANSTIFK